VHSINTFAWFYRIDLSPFKNRLLQHSFSLLKIILFAENRSLHWLPNFETEQLKQYQAKTD